MGLLDRIKQFFSRNNKKLLLPGKEENENIMKYYEDNGDLIVMYNVPENLQDKVGTNNVKLIIKGENNKLSKLGINNLNVLFKNSNMNMETMKLCAGISLKDMFEDSKYCEFVLNEILTKSRLDEFQKSNFPYGYMGKVEKRQGELALKEPSIYDFNIIKNTLDTADLENTMKGKVDFSFIKENDKQEFPKKLIVSYLEPKELENNSRLNAKRLVFNDENIILKDSAENDIKLPVFDVEWYDSNGACTLNSSDPKDKSYFIVQAARVAGNFDRERMKNDKKYFEFIMEEFTKRENIIDERKINSLDSIIYLGDVQEDEKGELKIIKDPNISSIINNIEEKASQNIKDNRNNDEMSK